jgi:radical SAM superfamily enzyme YgiQ (UPF0313 family)
LGIAVFPPIGLEYVASALKDHVEKVSFVDLRMPGPLRDPVNLRRHIANEVDLLCISVNWEYFFDEVCQLINGLPRDVFTVVGGQQATMYVDEVFEKCPGVDVVVRGEGEETIAEIAAGAPLENILGISHRSGSGLVHNEIRPSSDVNTYKYPDRSLRSQMYHFNLGGFAHRSEEFDIILTARGCPYNCKFCTFSLNPWTNKRRYSTRSIDSVIEELKSLSAGVILIADENFFVNPKRALELCERIIQEGINKRFVVQSRIEIYKHPDVLAKAYEAGVSMILLGIESPTDRILKQLNKGFDTALIREAFNVFKQFPFYYHGYFIYGNFTETEEEMMRIPVFARELGLDSITYQKLRIERYSPLKELADSTPGYYVGDDRIVYQEGLGRPYLKRISRQITRDFYTPPQLYRTGKKLFSSGIVHRESFLPLLLSLPVALLYGAKRRVAKRAGKYFSQPGSKIADQPPLE